MERGRMVVINFAFYALCAFNVPSPSSQELAETFDLKEGDVCHKGQGSDPDYVCARRELCEPSSAKAEVKNQERRKPCSPNGSISIVCCPPATVAAQPQTETNQTVAEKKCLKYLELAKSYPKTPTTESISNQSVSYLRSYVGEWIQNRTRQIFNYTVSDDVVAAAADPKKFPYMAIIGFGETIENSLWACGGSLISERWILTAAHCKQMGLRQIARWARVGGFDANAANTYVIVERIVYPDYKPPSLYNDVALFKLSTDVAFSSSVTPVCLNWDPMRNPTEQTATGRETELSPDGQYVDSVLEIRLLVVSGAQCNTTYYTSNRKQLKFGILDDRMMCAVSSDGKTDTCGGDSGGSLVAADVDRPGVYTQYGITSFGKYCGDKNIPGVYTKVSHYIRWIETTVWSSG